MSQEIIQTNTPENGIYSQGNFSLLCDISAKLAKSSLIPKALKGATHEETAANCLLVVEQSQRWGFSPFAVMQCASVISGKLMWEGKLIAAAIQNKIGTRLRYEYEGEGKKRKIRVIGKYPDEENEREISGDVATWETLGDGSPWKKSGNIDSMLAYRGAREWARRHAPSVILGVLGDDEDFETMGEIQDATPRKANVPEVKKSFIKTATDKEEKRDESFVETEIEVVDFFAFLEREISLLSYAGGEKRVDTFDALLLAFQKAKLTKAATISDISESEQIHICKQWDKFKKWLEAKSEKFFQ